MIILCLLPHLPFMIKINPMSGLKTATLPFEEIHVELGQTPIENKLRLYSKQCLEAAGLSRQTLIELG